MQLQTAKQEVTALLQNLPDGTSLEDIQYHLYVLEKVRNGLDAADRDGALSHAQVEEELSQREVSHRFTPSLLRRVQKWPFAEPEEDPGAS